MRARAGLIVGADPAGGPHRIIRMAPAAPVAWRPTPEGVFMVGTAASPVGDDEVALDVEVRQAAAIVVRSTAATVAWGGRGSRQTVTVDVADGGSLDWRPEPVIATTGCDHSQSANVTLAAGARLMWAEQLVLGRHGEAPGRLRASLSVAVAGRPLLRHHLEVGAGAPGWAGPAVLGAARAVGLLLVAGAGTPDVRASGPGWAVMPLEGPGAVGIAVASRGLELGEAMKQMRAVLNRGGWGRARRDPAADQPKSEH